MEEMKNEAETTSMVSMPLYAVMYPVFNEVTCLLVDFLCITVFGKQEVRGYPNILFILGKLTFSTKSLQTALMSPAFYLSLAWLISMKSISITLTFLAPVCFLVLAFFSGLICSQDTSQHMQVSEM